MNKLELLAHMRSHKLVVVSSPVEKGAPQGALAGIATTDDFQIVFDAASTSRKHGNFLRDIWMPITPHGRTGVIVRNGPQSPIGGSRRAGHASAIFLAARW
jgi:hypothetical protein